jgi:hypothetical protein
MTLFHPKDYMRKDELFLLLQTYADAMELDARRIKSLGKKDCKRGWLLNRCRVYGRYLDAMGLGRYVRDINQSAEGEGI